MECLTLLTIVEFSSVVEFISTIIVLFFLKIVHFAWLSSCCQGAGKNQKFSQTAGGHYNFIAGKATTTTIILPLNN